MPGLKKVGDWRTEIVSQGLLCDENDQLLLQPKGAMTFDRKNLPGWERAMRIIAGGAIIASGLIALSAAPVGYVIAGAGAVAILTGFFGICPMCAMVGRRLPSP